MKVPPYFKKFHQNLETLEVFSFHVTSTKFSCNALADLGDSINLMPYFLYTKLSLETLKPTKMSVRLAERSFQYPIGIAENMLVEVGKFTFCANFIILEMEEDSFSIDVIDEILEEDFDSLLEKGSKILHSIEGTILEEEIFAEFDEFMAMTADENSKSESDTEEPPFEKITFNTNYKIKTSLEEPPTDLEKITDILEIYAHLVLNWEKCHFMIKQGIMLGHKGSKAGLEVDKAKIDVISKLPPPTNIKGIRNFIGHAGFYRRFIKDFSKIARPLTKLLEKDTLFEFNEECHNAFKLLKEKLTCAPVIISPNWNLLFEIMCDASDFAVGAILVFRDQVSILAKDKGFGQEMHQSEESNAVYDVTPPRDYDVTYSNEEMSHHTLYGIKCLQDYSATFKITRDDVADSALWRNMDDKGNVGSQRKCNHSIGNEMVRLARLSP
ncbi:reverse transcriptase domain-containing protein [Tanacetum coccineum]